MQIIEIINYCLHFFGGKFSIFKNGDDGGVDGGGGGFCLYFCILCFDIERPFRWLPDPFFCHHIKLKALAYGFILISLSR